MFIHLFVYLFSKANACLIIAFCNAASIEEEDGFAILDESDRLGDAISFSDQNSTIIIGEFLSYLLQQELCKSSNNKLSEYKN